MKRAEEQDRAIVLVANFIHGYLSDTTKDVKLATEFVRKLFESEEGDDEFERMIRESDFSSCTRLDSK